MKEVGMNFWWKKHNELKEIFKDYLINYIDMSEKEATRLIKSLLRKE